VIVVTHDPRMLQFATNTIYLLDGKVVSEESYKLATESMAQAAVDKGGTL
jgi:putative ABC transport system ATP-binding protein